MCFRSIQNRSISALLYVYNLDIYNSHRVVLILLRCVFLVRFMGCSALPPSAVFQPGLFVYSQYRLLDAEHHFSLLLPPPFSSQHGNNVQAQARQTTPFTSSNDSVAVTTVLPLTTLTHTFQPDMQLLCVPTLTSVCPVTAGLLLGARALGLRLVWPESHHADLDLDRPTGPHHKNRPQLDINRVLGD